MYRYTIDEEARLVVAIFEGEVGDADLFGYLADMLSNTNYGPGWRTLIDLASVSVLGVTIEGVRRMRNLPREMEERLRGARAGILAPAGSAAFGMSRMYQTLGDAAPYEIAVFTDRERAITWLLAD